MSKVIRVSDTVFARLQRHGEPLVDTPGSVIERILDFYERAEGRAEQRVHEFAPAVSRTVVRESPGGQQPGIYLAPSDKENLQATIVMTKSLDLARQHLQRAQYEALERVLDGETRFHCWAMTQGSRAEFSDMRRGDRVFFTPKGTGKFQFVGRVIHKLESLPFGRALWEVVPGNPWELIYVLDDIQKVDIDKKQLVTDMSYAENFVVQGITRPKHWRVQRLIEKYGCIDKMIAALNQLR